jgi:hypothetical protein
MILKNGMPIAFSPQPLPHTDPNRSAAVLGNSKKPPQGEAVMSVAKEKRSQPMSRQVARRQASIRSSWSPLERRERARQASAQISLLWAMIQPCHK